MTETPRQARLLRAYHQLRETIEAALYEEDPAGFGATVAAPRDEYAAETSRLITQLKDCETIDDVRLVLIRIFTTASPSLVRRVHEAWSRFSSQSARNDA